MDTVRKSIIGDGALAVVLALTGCDGGPSPTPSPSESSAAPSPSPTPDPSATAAAAAAADEALLPIAPEDLKTWSEASLPGSGQDGTLATFYGWLSANTQRTTTAEFGPAPAGEYLVTVACAGESTLTVEITSSDGTPAGSTTCSGGSVAIEATTTSSGLRAAFTIGPEDPPTDYAISFQTAPGG